VSSPPAGRLAIERLVEADWAVLRELRLAALTDTPTAFASTLERELSFDEARWRQRLRGTNPSFVARSHDEVAGLAGGFVDGDEWHLVSMWIRPTWRRRGVARSLIDEVVAWARRDGAPRLYLWVTDGNAPARASYQQSGFVPTGRRQALPSDASIDELEMALELPAGS
jgi:GNAT superfamily N-acetyltransferase